MKYFLIAVIALGIITSCEIQEDDLSIYQNNLDEQTSTQETIEINLSLYPSVNSSNLDLPVNFSHLTLKKGLTLSGSTYVLDKMNVTKGSFNCHSFTIDSTNENIKEEFSGILALNNNDLIFYSGSTIINIENQDYEGVFNISNGTGKFGSCKANLNVKGIIDFKSGYKTMVASGNISLYN